MPTVTGGVFDGIYVAINDYISFTHKNGLVTRSRVLGHAKIDNVADGAPNAVPSDKYTISGNGVNTSVTILLSDSNANNVVVGMEVTGANVAARSFVTQIQEGNTTRMITLSEQLTTDGESSFTFISTTGIFFINKKFFKFPVDLAWHNCYSFGNGVESDRIRDDFNAPQIDNGIKASSVFLEYGEENKSSSIIYSGIYNSTSSTNNLNQFNMAEKITKDLNTTYGSIQAMKARDNDIVVFTEDKVLKVMSSGKDVLFNAGGNAQLTSTDRVLGTSTPFAGDYGISKNPESLAVDAYRMYFTDKERGAVLRLSGNGITPISDIGMKGYFREKLKYYINVLGSFDSVNDEYNLTLLKTTKFPTSSVDKTISFNEKSKGWISFKSFIPTSAVSVVDRYYTTNENKIYKHYSSSSDRNTFYSTHTPSTVDILFNEGPSAVKSFSTISYEGSQSKVLFNNFDEDFYNVDEKDGWYAESISTDLQKGYVPEFIQKEGKWFNYIRGEKKGTTNDLQNDVDVASLNVQGLGFLQAAPVAIGFTINQPVIATGTDEEGNDYPQTLSE